MIDVRIVCTLDALKTAEALTRLLSAEGHQVRLCYGRTSIDHLAASCESSEAVLLIWSASAPATQYMDDWISRVPAARLIEIALTPNGRHAGAIDFSAWRGERGARAWSALNERLRQVARATAPRKPPPVRAAFALGVISAAAVSGAVIVRLESVDRIVSPVVADAEDAIDMDYERSAGVGGALRTVEPASASDLDIAPASFAVPPALPPLARRAWGEPVRYEEPDLRDATLLERLVALNPIARDEDETP